MPDKSGRQAGERYWSSEGVNCTEARWRLARFLHETLDYLDPGPNFKPWEELSECDRSLYFDAVSSMMDLEGLVLKALKEDDPPRHSFEDRHN